jgi:transposase-like protein
VEKSADPHHHGGRGEERATIYTTNALERVHARVRTIIKTRGHFPTDEAATKLIGLAPATLR